MTDVVHLYLALGLSLCHQVAVESVKHGGHGGGLRLLFLAEYSEEAFPLRFFWSLGRSLPDYDRKPAGHSRAKRFLLAVYPRHAAKFPFLVLQ